ncbi:RpiB/LacA/LacB family sugar-phosphate isomerase [Candidatus Bipolaricaulota bacterium]|nr:RpiB/LacA/LacB family sugar-phosphate isomerase [Candidatus Bipolaricaulota bacterium]
MAADHGGFDLKQELIQRLSEVVDLVDLGAESFDSSDDYPDFAILAAQAIASGEVQRAVVICGSGVGASIVCNKVKGVRAGLCHDTYSAHQGVEHDDMNALCLGARVIGIELATEIVAAFLMARFSGEERHLRRIAKLNQLEA